jgi:hypothetical protein
MGTRILIAFDIYSSTKIESSGCFGFPTGISKLLCLPRLGDGNFIANSARAFCCHPWVTFSIGVFLVGWLALKLRWLNAEMKLPARVVATLIGAYLPLIACVILYHLLEPGNPFFFISMLASILGFHLPGWMARK